MIATGPLQIAIHSEPVPRKECDYGKKSSLSGIQRSPRLLKLISSLSLMTQLPPREEMERGWNNVHLLGRNKTRAAEGELWGRLGGKGRQLSCLP